jgi:valine--pyruvate aminotransferase
MPKGKSTGVEDVDLVGQECIRLNYAQSEDLVRRGIAILADEINALYAS